jgi:signal transduction histidine kinase/ActR/RegA family two-component response regulator
MKLLQTLAAESIESDSSASRADLQACLRDLVTLVALPSLWTGRESSDVVRVFLDAAGEVLRADYLYVRCESSFGSVEDCRVGSGCSNGEGLEIGNRLRDALVQVPYATPASAVLPQGRGRVGALRLPLGATGENGELIVASRRESYPSENDRLLARIAANQLNAGLVQARLSAERKRDADRLAVLSRAGELLSSTIDYEATLRNVVGVALPDLADFGFFDVLEPDGSVRRIPRAHQNPRKQELLDATRWVRSERTDMNLCALSTGSSGFHPHVDDVWLNEVALSPAHLALMRELAFHSMITVPLRHEDSLLGALTLFFADSPRRHTLDDVRLAEEIARRAAGAVATARLYRALEEAVRLRDEADRRKDEFLAMLGHELRNPLSPIMTALQLMRLRGDPSFDRERQIIERQVRHLERLVDDLLDISRVTRGKLELHRRTIEMGEVVAQAVESASPLMEQKRQRLTLAVDARGLLVDVDRTRMAQVLTNLLTNAAKYTPDGGEISLSARVDGEDVIVSVRDTGDGISQDLLPRIFDMFVQAPQALARSQGGLGLGLTISKRLVEFHGGTIEAYSGGPGQGSRFDLRLPRIHRTPLHAEEAESTRGQVTAEEGRLRILVVDDNRDAADLVMLAMCDRGHDVEVAYDGPSAIKRAESFRPDVVFLDIGLPVLDGYDVAQHLRACAWAQSTRLVAMTGYGQEADKAKTAAAGFDAHLVKPVDVDMLVGALQSSANRR